MIIAVMEIYEDGQPCSYLCDTEKANPYLKEAIEKALAGVPHEMPYDAGFQMPIWDENDRLTDQMNPAIVNPPCEVKESVTVYATGWGVYDE